MKFGTVARRILCCAFVALPLLLTSSDVHNPDGFHEPFRSLDEYGIDTTLFRATDDRVRRNQTLSTILAGQGIERQTAAAVAEKARPVFDPRRIRAGNRLRTYADIESGETVLLVYRSEPERYVVFDFRDSVRVWDGLLPATVVQRSAMGSIRNSMYETLAERGANPALAIKLARVFAWQVDFHRLRPGDAFHVIYDEREVDGTSVDIEIVAARFAHAGSEYHAFRFETGFYDEEGNTMRRAFLRAPIEYTRISSRYSRRRFHPVQRRYKPHLGTDFAAPAGTPIRATGDGVVTHATYTKGNGRYVKIRHNGTYSTAYLHMSRIADGIRPGVRVKQEDVIGYVGSTGLATGPHVCYRFWMRGRQVDPLMIDLPPAEPIADEHRAAFFETRDRIAPRLVFP